MKPIKICLAWHNINSTNYGVSALAVAQVALLVESASRSKVAIELETFGTPFVNELSIRKEVEQRFAVKLTHRDFSLKKFIVDFAKLDFSGLRLFDKYDIVMDIGEGDSFTDIYGIKRFITFSITKYLALRVKKKLILSPQTIGPFNSRISYIIARYLISKCDSVFSRDYKSTKFIHDMGLNCEEVSDVAFTLPYDTLPKIDNSIGINISGLLWNGGYTGDNQFGLTVDYKLFVKEIIELFRVRGKEVHLIGHVIADHLPVEDDYRVCNQIKEMFSLDNGVIVAPKFTSPIQAKTYMSQLTFFTGSRMHATIGALSAGVVTVPIAYSRKFSGVFGSLDYRFTLDAYTLDTKSLVTKLFEYYDNNFEEMQSAMINARIKANQRNEKYVGYLQELLSNEKIAQVIESGMCVGCGFCTENPNGMDINKEGYYRPISFIDDSLSQLVCPGKSISHNNSMAPYNLLWGPVVSCESGNAVDPDIRHKGSSGGVLTAIAVYLVDSGLVDAIIQVGVSVDNPIRNVTYIMKSQEDILKCAGSRYSPSSPLSVIRSLLGNGTRYAVIGKPCDIAAMRTLVNSRQEFQEQFPYLLSFMCAGVPSEEGTRNILERWHIKHEHLISFRYRGDGWPD